MKISNLNKESDIGLYAKKKEKSARFSSKIVELTELTTGDKEVLLDKFKTLDNICVIEPISYDNTLIKMDEQGISYHLIGTFDAKPFLWNKVKVPRVTLPDKGHVHVLIAENDGQPFNRRDNFRLWLGVEGIGKFAGRPAIHNIVVKDVSEQGLGFIFDRKHDLKVGDECNIQFYDYVYNEVKKENVPIKYVVLCNIVRIVEIDESTALAGCLITKTTNNIQKLVMKKQRERLRVGGRKELYKKKSDSELLENNNLS